MNKIYIVIGLTMEEEHIEKKLIKAFEQRVDADMWIMANPKEYERYTRVMISEIEFVAKPIRYIHNGDSNDH